MKCACCAAERGGAERAAVANEWEHRMNDYCYACASMRCDAFPGLHERNRPQPKQGYIDSVVSRRALPAVVDDIPRLRTILDVLAEELGDVP